MSAPKNGFIVLMAFLMSLIALSIDSMLPALGEIKKSLSIENANDVQLIISTVFLGMSFGLMLYGPLSDAIGRKKPLYIGISIFIVGSFISLISHNLEVMLLGRFLQGFGAAACRVVSLAMIRDQFSGVEMGKVMSLIMVIFIIVPALAPTIGQFILYFGTWPLIFGIFILLGLLAIILLRFRLEETLSKNKRIPFSGKNLMNGIKETMKNPISRAYTLVSGLVFGAFVGYLSLSQQILQDQYRLGDKFSYYFGVLALFIGMSSYINSRLVEKFGMEKLSIRSLVGLFSLSSIYMVLMYFSNGETSLYVFLGYLGLSFLFVGILFGNLTSLAIQPLGHIAGIANSVISCIQTFISVGIGAFIGHHYTGNVYPLVISFLVLSLTSICIIKFSFNRNKSIN